MTTRTEKLKPVATAIPNHSAEELLYLYRAILKPRLIEEKMLLLLRQGKISKWFSGIGQEAISVGATAALDSDEFILPLHRNLGVFTTRQVDLARLFAQFQGCAQGFTKGRDRSFHFGVKSNHIIGMISHLGPQLSVAVGLALGHKLRHQPKTVLAFSGEGGTSQGEFHEALNVAAVWKLPVIFVIENNGYGLSTPASEQYACRQLSDRALGYGIEGLTIDGNDLLQVYDRIKGVAHEIRANPRPFLIECMTFRMRGHEEASGVKYVPKELFDLWSTKDPVLLFESKLKRAGILDQDKIDACRDEISKEIEKAIEYAFSLPPVTADTQRELLDRYAPVENVSKPKLETKHSTRRFVDAISDGLRSSMRSEPNLILMGQDIAEYGGVFKVTEGFLSEFGPERVRNTPLCESAIVGASLGLSIAGFKSVVEMQFADFVTCGFNQIINNLAKTHYRWGQNVDVVIRMPTGAGTGAGPFHSQSNEAWFAHTPGLKVVYPSNPYDAKGLLISAIRDPNPVIFFEHKLLYRSIKGEVPDELYSIEIGKAQVIQSGTQAAVITYGLGVHWAKEVLARHPELSIYLVDLRSLLPLDYDAIDQAVRATGRVIILHEDTLFGGLGGEIAGYISQQLFEYLDAPIYRTASLDTPVPFANELERDFLAKARFEQDLLNLLKY